MANNLHKLLRLICCATLLVAVARARADEPVEPRVLRFEADVLPILREHCLKCHGQESRKGDLSLRTIGGIVRGGESGEPVVLVGDAAKSRLIELVKAGEMPPGDERLGDAEVQVLEQWINSAAQRGNATDSLLLRRIRDDQMPPRNVRYKLSIQPVSEPEQALIREWIEGGAIDPPPPPGVVDDDGLLVSAEDRRWWAFQPPVAAAVPSVAARERVRTPIDAFLLAELEPRNLTFSGEAVDPENRLLWRMPLRRMDAEVVRDSMLAVAGKLDWKMFNSGFVDQQAEDLARQIASQTDDRPQQIAAAYNAVLGRQATSIESAAADDFLRQQNERYNRREKTEGEAEEITNSALVDLCLVLLNSAEFLYVD